MHLNTPRALAGVFALALAARAQSSANWAQYLGDEARSHYSVLDQINVSNVTGLHVAWEYRTGVLGEMQFNPLVIDGVLYGATSDNQVFALDAANGREIWRFVPPGERSNRTLRGLAYWSEGGVRRILCTANSELCALDADTGRVVESFGQLGWVSLKAGLGEESSDRWVVSTSPGTIFGNIIVMPTRVSEGANAAKGHIQAFDVRTGKLVWVFRTIPLPGESGADTWPAEALSDPLIGGANSWAGMALDSQRELLFVPTGSAAPDFWGGNRSGRNLFANCLLAIDVKNGKLRWHYQFVHHDIWDRDLPAPPNLVRVRRDGETVDAVAQVTKAGYVFLFNRETGEPLFPVDEVPMPRSGLPGEEAWPTQPIPRLPLPFTRQNLAEEDIGMLAPNRDELRQIYRTAHKGTFMPFSEEPTLLFPGFDGGAEWGGAAADPEGVLYVNANEMAWVARLRKPLLDSEIGKLSAGQGQYMLYCSPCHGAERQGNPASAVPALVDLASRLGETDIQKIVQGGKGMMPGFPMLSQTNLQVLLDYLLGREKTEGPQGASREMVGQSSASAPYELSGYVRFVDGNGHPAINPPWGTLTAIDLNSGRHKWQIPLGDTPELAGKWPTPTGTENYGGPIVTGGGLLFIGASKDGKFRAFDKATGDLLWEHTLPAPAFATPATYAVRGKQYVVVAAGGTKLGSSKGDSYVAFALP